MSKKITVVMYHYVRKLLNSRYPNIKGLELSQFREQLNYLQRKYCIVSMEDVIEASQNRLNLPEKAALLTFDDGYSDHFNFVYPELLKRKLTGSFFVPAKPVLEHVMLDVNKIHYVLAAASDVNTLVRDIFNLLDFYRTNLELYPNEYYFNKLAVPSRHDPAEVIFVKRLLQKELPEGLRNGITSKLFEKYIGQTEEVFSKELYMTKTQITEMRASGMHIGHHGYDHYWLNTMSEDNQRKDIVRGCEFLKSVGADMDNWTMCYPYGAFDEATQAIIQDLGCRVAFATTVDVAELSDKANYRLPRLDTNDLV